DDGNDGDGEARQPEEGALARRRRLPTPPMILARTLQEASAQSLVHVDGKGQVRSPARFHAVQALSYGLLAASLGGMLIVSGALFGPVGAVIGGGLALLFGWPVVLSR